MLSAVERLGLRPLVDREQRGLLRLAGLQFGLQGLSSTQGSRAAKLVDDELEAWRCRTLGEVRYLFLDAR